MSGFDLPVYFVTEAAENNESMKIKVGINLLKADLKDPEKSKALSAFAQFHSGVPVRSTWKTQGFSERIFKKCK